MEDFKFQIGDPARDIFLGECVIVGDKRGIKNEKTGKIRFPIGDNDLLVALKEKNEFGLHPVKDAKSSHLDKIDGHDYTRS